MDKSDPIGVADATSLVERRRSRLKRRGGGVEPALAQQFLGEEVGISPEQDVGAAPGHVGGHRDPGRLAGLADHLAPDLVVRRHTGFAARERF